MAQLNDWSKMNQPRIGVDGRPVGESVTTPARSPVDDALDRLEREISFLESVIRSDEGYTETVIAQVIESREDIATVRDALQRLRETWNEEASELEELRTENLDRALSAEAEVRQLREAQASLLAEQVRLTEGLRDCVQEIDELGDAYTRLRKKYEPPYVLYASWAKPKARALLSAGPSDGGGA